MVLTTSLLFIFIVVIMKSMYNPPEGSALSSYLPGQLNSNYISQKQAFFSKPTENDSTIF